VTLAARTPQPEEFQRLYQAEFDYVWNALRRLGVADANREDLCHDVFVTAWRKLSDYDPTRPLRPWLFGIAYRVASDFRQRAFHHREVSDEEADAPDDRPQPDEEAARQQARSVVRRALEAIPIDRRGVFVMHDIDGTPIPEVALALEIPLNTAYSRLRLARRDFSNAVEQLKAGAR
jgi:RNA polymerase sigma-70 factor (ECF subfamily)